MALKFTTLSITVPANTLLENNRQAIENARLLDQPNNSFLEQSKVIGPLMVQLRALINQQCQIYVKEEMLAVEFITESHKSTKEAATKCEQLAAALKKKYDERGAEMIRRLAVEARSMVSEVDATRKAMVAHQDFRGAFCTPDLAKELIGERAYNELDAIYKGFRQPPLNALAAAITLETKSQEHAKRCEQYVSLLPALAKANQDGGDVLAAITADRDELQKLHVDLLAGKKDFQSTDKLNVILDKLKKHKTAPITPVAFKSDVTVRFNNEVVKVKSIKATVKTAELKADTAKKKAGAHASDPTIKPLIKQIVDFADDLIAANKKMVKVFEDTEKELNKVKALIK